MRRSVAWGLALVTMAVGTSCHLLVGVEDVVLDPSTSSTSSTSSTTSTTSTTSTSSTTSTGGGGSSSTTSTTSTSTTTTTSTSGTGGAGGSGGAGGGATTCTALPTLVAHWDPASLLLADGDPVITWMGGNFLDLTQSDPTLRPTYKAAAINGQPALLFDGTPAKLTSLNGDVPWDKFGLVKAGRQITVVMVARSSVAEQDQIALLYGQPAAASGLLELGICGCGLPRGWHFRMVNAGLGQEISVQAPATQDTVPNVLTAVMTTTDSKLFKNGLLLQSVATTPVEFTTGFFQIGSAYIELPWNGLIAEIALFNGGLSDIDRHAVETCLGAKYGIAVQ